jgi:hypothetical protein
MSTMMSSPANWLSSSKREVNDKLVPVGIHSESLHHEQDLAASAPSVLLAASRATAAIATSQQRQCCVLVSTNRFMRSSFPSRIVETKPKRGIRDVALVYPQTCPDRCSRNG